MPRRDVDRLDAVDEAVFGELEHVLADVDPHRPHERRLADREVVDEERRAFFVGRNLDRGDELLHDRDRVLELLRLGGAELPGAFAQLSVPRVDGASVVGEQLLGDAQVEEHARVVRELVRALELDERALVVGRVGELLRRVPRVAGRLR